MSSLMASYMDVVDSRDKPNFSAYLLKQKITEIQSLLYAA